MLAVFFTFLIRNTGYYLGTLCSSLGSEIPKKKGEKSEFTSILLKLEKTALGSFFHSFGCNFKPYNPMYHQCQESIERYIIAGDPWRVLRICSVENFLGNLLSLVASHPIKPRVCNSLMG